MTLRELPTSSQPPPKCDESSCLLGSFDALVNRIRPPLLRNHDYKALEIRRCSPLLRRSALFRPRRLLPLLNDGFRLNLLLDDT